ncbi:hypothetical protein N9459_02885 [Flavobacteriaceae bacterium]|nr:hypothetical protein [Flavobacteriaceae bacterium]
MNVVANPNSVFPSQVVTNAEKDSPEYGRQVAQAIESEWFNQGGYGNRFATNFNHFHSLRLYARGEQPVQKYKDELAINGDLSYLNLDWKPVPVISKFVDIVTNGITEKKYEISAYAQDPESIKKRTNYAESIMRDMVVKEQLTALKETLGIDAFNTSNPEELPQTKEELSLHMQLDYKQSIEIAEEEAINQVLAKNKFDEIRKRFNYDLTVLGIGAVKTNWNKANGVKVEYCDPANLVYSYTEDPNFEDIYYIGEVKAVTIPELKKQFPNIPQEELKRIEDMPGNREYLTGWKGYDENTVQVLYFEYKTYNNQVFKIKTGPNGLEKVIQKSDDFNPPENDTFKKVSRSIEVLYSGAKVLGTNTMLKWELSENMTRPYADTTKVEMNYVLCAPRMYNGRIESVVSKITGFADMIQITHLKLQQVMTRMVPDGVFLDVDGLAEVDLGNGTSYNPAEALSMYFQTGSVLGRSLTQDGELNRGKVPIQELTTSSGGAKIQSLIQTYQYYLQMIRDVTGLNEARDGSAPSKDALVGLQKMAANQSNVATRHILQASCYLTLRACENISRRVADSLDFALTANSLQNSITKFNTATMAEMSQLNLHDFGIFLELEPDDEAKAQLEQNIQVALQGGGIDLEDAIDIRQIKNLQLANEMLKDRRKKKQEAARQAQLQNIQAQADANAQASERAAMAEAQKQQVITAEKVSLEKAKTEFEIQKLQAEAQVKRELMAEEFNYNVQLSQAKGSVELQKEKDIEDRKDERIRMQGTQQSELIDQRKNNLLPKNFESSGNDVLGGIGLDQFEPS